MEYILDGNLMTDIDVAHEYIARELSFPDYYGSNFDALYDCLCEKCGDTVVIINTDKIMDNLNQDGNTLISIFGDAANEGFIDLELYDEDRY